jgi:chitinase
MLMAIFLAFTVQANAAMWVTGYYPGYKQDILAVTNIDFTALTHVIHFSLAPSSDGTINGAGNGITPQQSTNLVALAHAAGVKVIICVGGANTEAGFQGATSSANLLTFINNLTSFVSNYNYDGVDIDWEALPASDFQQYTNFVIALRSALNALPQPKLLTAAVPAYPVYGDPANSEALMFASVQTNFDQINIMTYDLSGPYPGWVTWFNSPFFDGGLTFPGTSELVPSIDAAISTFMTNGVVPGRLAIAAAFYGYVWVGGKGGTVPTGGVTQPRQFWSNAPTVTTVGYASIYSTYYQSNLYHWDPIAEAAYLSITNGNNNSFISYDDQYTCEAKVSYVRNRHLGGLMIWELTQDVFPGEPAGQQQPLLQSVKAALQTPGDTAIQIFSQKISLNFNTLPMGLYRVQWTSNAVNPNWNTLTNNVQGNGQSLQIIDTNVSQPQRLYRIQTPP